ncbi:MAG: ral secretion pathway protein [Candidatus Dependentiae bacterium]|nr:ral secretion pathway protein [Candidatus Dependentiae bacterium]
MNEPIYSVQSIQTSEVVYADTVSLTDYLLFTAVSQQASDIHIQFQEYDVVVRLRIDGVLAPFIYLARQQAQQMLSRIKIMMSLDSTQTHEPQDGAVRLHVAKKIIDIRGSFFPSLQGEKAVIRLLEGHYGMVQLHTLPFASTVIQALYAVARQDQGLFLVTGPTGSGKTTTLYALLQAIDRISRNVVTLENPVEYRIAHVTQTQIDTTHSLTFAQAVRSLLRQDPDVALIGELRDADTVHSAVEAALTGHLVLSSLHAGRASGVPIRLREMGVETYLIAHALKGVLAQRLLLKLCEHCKITVPLSTQERTWVLRQGLSLESTGFAPGCPICRYTGCQGQIVIAELWQCDGVALGHLLQDPATGQEDFERLAKKTGMVPLLVAGAALVRQGVVALSELMNRDL